MCYTINCCRIITVICRCFHRLEQVHAREFHNREVDENEMLAEYLRLYEYISLTRKQWPEWMFFLAKNKLHQLTCNITTDWKKNCMKAIPISKMCVRINCKQRNCLWLYVDIKKKRKAIQESNVNNREIRKNKLHAENLRLFLIFQQTAKQGPEWNYHKREVLLQNLRLWVDISTDWKASTWKKHL